VDDHMMIDYVDCVKLNEFCFVLSPLQKYYFSDIGIKKLGEIKSALTEKYPQYKITIL